MEDFEFLDTNFLDFSIYEDIKKNEEEKEEKEGEETNQEDQQCDLEEGCLTCGS